MQSYIRHIRESLGLKLSFGILLLAMPVFIVALGIQLMYSRYYVKQEATERAKSELQAMTQHIDKYLRTVETATNANEWLVKEHVQPDSLLAFTRRIVMLNANVSGCSITTEPGLFPQYGRYFSAYTIRRGDSIVTAREAEYEYFEKTWYKTPRLLGRPCWVDPFNDFTAGTLSASSMIASYCKPLYDADGRFFGVISSDLSMPKLAEILQAKKPYPNSYFMMLGEDGHYFVHPDTARLVSQTIFSRADADNQSDIIALGHEMTTGHQGTMRTTVDGQPCLVCYCPVEGTRWSLALVCHDSDILKSYNRLTYIVVPLTIAGLLLILLFCHQIVSHSIRALTRLETQAQRMADGHYGEQMDHSRRLDAVGQLQNSFALMQQSINRHVSDIRRANAETGQRNTELRQASLMAEESIRQKTAFIQNMTHQIRTPLNIIIGFVQVLRDNVSQLPDEEVRSITDMMNHNAMTLNRMVLMLYDSSDSGLAEELASHRHETVACNEVAQESIALTRPHFPALSIAFSTTLPDTTSIQTNRLYFLRSLREILYNSAKYSDGQHISISLSETADTVRFVLQDTGKGIAADYQDMMFEPFTKVDDLSEGLGLGLPLAKRHITFLGGEMVLDTTYRDGCRFIIEMPK